MENKKHSIALLSGKGGSGKTVLSLAFSKVLTEAGFNVLLVDCDLVTHGATYFFESELEEDVLSLTDALLPEGVSGKTPLKTKIGFDFIPSTLHPELYEHIGVTDHDKDFENILNVGSLVEKYDVIILDCQAGYSDIVRSAAHFANYKLIVLEPDAVSSSALRVLHLQLGSVIGRSNTWQLFNKLTEEERPIYEKVSGGTLFPNLPPVPFDWLVRAAFATCEIPSIAAKTSAFGLGVIRIMKIVFKPLSEKLTELENRTVGDWYEEVRDRLEKLAEKKSQFEKRFTEKRRKERLNFARLVMGTGLAFGLAMLFPPLWERFDLLVPEINSSRFLLATLGMAVACVSMFFFFWTLRTVRSERTREEDLKTVKEIETEMERFTTLLATDPRLREYSRKLASEARVSKSFEAREVFVDDFETFSGWEQISNGEVSQSTDFAHSGLYSLKKDKANDPNGGFKMLSEAIHRGFAFSGWIYRPSSSKGGVGDRLAIEDDKGNGYGFSISHKNSSTIAQIEIRKSGIGKKISGESAELKPGMLKDDWYYFFFQVNVKDTIELKIDGSGKNRVVSISVEDSTFEVFRRIAVRGGHTYYVDDLRSEAI